MSFAVHAIHVTCAHALRQVRLHQTSLVCVTQGYKDVFHHNAWQRYQPGQLLLFNAHTQWQFHNHPAPHGGGYQAQMVELPSEWLASFAQQSIASEKTQTVFGMAALPLAAWVRQAWAHLTDPQLASASPALVRHRAFELLLTLAQAGYRLPYLPAESLQQRIHALVQQDLLQPWRAASLASQFHMSVSTLLRRLQSEGTTISRCVRDARLDRALSLLQTTQQSVGHVAELCGYASHSRFSAAFEERFGLLPLSFRKQAPSMRAA